MEIERFVPKTGLLLWKGSWAGCTIVVKAPPANVVLDTKHYV